MDKFTKIRYILIVTLCLNWLVAFSKLIYGIMSKCASMSADGIHSFGDGASNIIGLLGILVACKPKDKEHPYGHKKFETMATLGIAAILFIAAFNIIRSALFRIFHPVIPDITVASFIIMFATLVINFFVMNYERIKGTELSSDILTCDALHTKSDILASIVVIFTLIAIKTGFLFLDTVVAILIALLIAKSAYDILKKSSNILCDASVLPESQVIKIVKNIEGVRSVHKIRTRGRTDDIYIDLHVAIDPSISVNKAHNISHMIEDRLKNAISGITDVIIHVEPKK